MAPPRRSVPRKVAAEAQAVDTNWETDKAEARTLSLRWAMSRSSINGWAASGTGSCHSSGSAGTSGPRYRLRGPMSRWISLNQALAKASS